MTSTFPNKQRSLPILDLFSIIKVSKPCDFCGIDDVPTAE